MQFQEQQDSVQLSLMQSITALGAHLKGGNSELLVLVLLLGRIGDPNPCMTAMAAELLLGMTPSKPLSRSLAPAPGSEVQWSKLNRKVIEADWICRLCSQKACQGRYPADGDPKGFGVHWTSYHYQACFAG